MVPSNILHFIPIAIQNTQTSIIKAGTQIKLTIDWTNAAFSGFENANLQNVQFFDFTGTLLFAWRETGTSSSATNSIVYVKLGPSDAIQAASTINIYLGFYATSTNNYNPTGHWGTWPTFTGTYAQYDNGALVFDFYDNFAGSSLAGSWTQTNVSPTVSNGLTLTGTAAAWDDIKNSFTVNVGEIIESSMNAQAGSYIAIAIFGGISYQIRLPNNQFAMATPVTAGSFASGGSPTANRYDLITGFNNNAAEEDVNYTSTVTGATTAVSGGFSVYIFSTISTGKFQWVRARSPLPNNVAPTIYINQQAFQQTPQLSIKNFDSFANWPKPPHYIDIRVNYQYGEYLPYQSGDTNWSVPNALDKFWFNPNDVTVGTYHTVSYDTINSSQSFLFYDGTGLKASFASMSSFSWVYELSDMAKVKLTPYAWANINVTSFVYDPLSIGYIVSVKDISGSPHSINITLMQGWAGNATDASFTYHTSQNGYLSGTAKADVWSATAGNVTANKWEIAPKATILAAAATSGGLSNSGNGTNHGFAALQYNLALTAGQRKTFFFSGSNRGSSVINLFGLQQVQGSNPGTDLTNRQRYYTFFPLLTTQNSTMAQLMYSSISQFYNTNVLTGNYGNGIQYATDPDFYTVFSWDQLLATIPVSYFNLTLAQSMVSSVVSNFQNSHGEMVGVGARAMPPSLAYFVWRIYTMSGDKIWLSNTYTAMTKEFYWWWDNRDLDATGLLSNGNSTVIDWFQDSDRIGSMQPANHFKSAWANAWMALDITDLKLIARELGHSSDYTLFSGNFTSLAGHMNTRMWNKPAGVYVSIFLNGTYTRDTATGHIVGASGTSLFVDQEGLLPIMTAIPNATQGSRMVNRWIMNSSEFLVNYPIPEMPKTTTAESYPANPNGPFSSWSFESYFIASGMRYWNFTSQSFTIASDALNTIMRAWNVEAKNAQAGYSISPYLENGTFPEYFTTDHGYGQGKMRVIGVGSASWPIPLFMEFYLGYQPAQLNGPSVSPNTPSGFPSISGTFVQERDNYNVTVSGTANKPVSSVTIGGTQWYSQQLPLSDSNVVVTLASTGPTSPLINFMNSTLLKTFYNSGTKNFTFVSTQETSYQTEAKFVINMSKASGPWATKENGTTITTTYNSATGLLTFSAPQNAKYEIRITPATPPVTETITVTMGAGPVTTITIGGSCSPSYVNNTFTTAHSHTFTATASCAISYLPPANSTNIRFIFTGNHGSVGYTTIGSGSESHSFTLYEQLQNTYQASPTSNTNHWDFTSSILATGSRMGSSATATINAISGSGAASVAAFFDYNTLVTLDAIHTVSGTEQWTQSGGNTFTQTTGGNTNNVNYVRQWLLTMAASPSNCGSTAPSGTVFENDGATVGGISATPVTGCTFTAWTGTGSGSYTGAANPTSITMNAAITETAGFTGTPLGFCTTAQSIVNNGTSSFQLLSALFTVMAAGTVVAGMMAFVRAGDPTVIPLVIFLVLLTGTVIIGVELLFGVTSSANDTMLRSIGCVPQ